MIKHLSKPMIEITNQINNSPFAQQRSQIFIIR